MFTEHRFYLYLDIQGINKIDKSNCPPICPPIVGHYSKDERIKILEISNFMPKLKLVLL